MVDLIIRVPGIFLLLLAGILTLLLLLGAVSYRKKSRDSRWYLLAVLPAAVWLVTPIVLTVTKPYVALSWPVWLQAIYTELRSPQDWFMLPIFLLYLVFVVWVVWGRERSRLHTETFSSRRVVWVVFGLVAVFVAWFVPTTLLTAQQDFGGRHVDLTYDIRSQISGVTNDAYRMADASDPSEVATPLLSCPRYRAPFVAHAGESAAGMGVSRDAARGRG